MPQPSFDLPQEIQADLSAVGLKPLAMPASLRDFVDLGFRFPGAEAPGFMPVSLRDATGPLGS